MPPPTLSSSSKKSGHCLHLAEMLPPPPPQSLQGCRCHARYPAKQASPSLRAGPAGGPQPLPRGTLRFRGWHGASEEPVPPPPREVAGLGSPCKKYSAEITPLAGNASRASSSLGLHNRPDFTLTLSVQAQKALASIGQAINPAERARFKCSRANRRDFPGGGAQDGGLRACCAWLGQRSALTWPAACDLR